MGIIFLSLFVLTVFYVKNSYHEIPAGEKGVRFTLGKAEKQALNPGPCFVFHPLQKLETFDSTIFSLDWPETKILSGKGDPKSDDPLDCNSIEVDIDLDIRLQITDPVAMVNNIGLNDLKTALYNEAMTILTNYISTQSLRKAIEGWESIRSKIVSHLNKLIENGEHWGAKVHEVNRKKLQPADPSVMETLNRRAQAEAEKQEQTIKAEAKKIKVVKAAEAEAQKIQQVAKALGLKGNTAQYFALLKNIEAIEAIASGESTKVVFPAELNLLGSIETIKGVLSDIKLTGGKDAK